MVRRNTRKLLLTKIRIKSTQRKSFFSQLNFNSFVYNCHNVLGMKGHAHFFIFVLVNEWSENIWVLSLWNLFWRRWIWRDRGVINWREEGFAMMLIGLRLLVSRFAIALMFWQFLCELCVVFRNRTIVRIFTRH